MNKQKITVTICFIAVLSIAVFFAGCEKDESDPQSKYPNSSDEIAEAVENTRQIATESEIYVEEAISNASAEEVDPAGIAGKIESIDNVESAEPTSSGTGVVVKQSDGTYSNVFIVTQDEERLFEEESSKKATNTPKTFITKDVKAKTDVFPDGDGKSLILAPFQADFDTDLDLISGLLEKAGFTVDIYTNDDATLDRFRGSFLDDYDVVIFRSHAAANLKTSGGDLSTMLLTGEKYTSEKMNALSEEERKSIGIGTHNNEMYFAFSVPWLELTHDEEFSNSWIYAGGCETAMVDQGSSSLSEAFLDLNCAGYNGFDGTINTAISNPIAEKMTAKFTSSLSFTDASNAVLDDFGLKLYSWTLRIVNGKSACLKRFDYNKNENISDPFYLADPESVVGIAEVIPDHGPVGTDVVYEVTVNDAFVSQVASIEFDIDNTGEHLTMEKVSSNSWQRDGLSAPAADSYPRIDTFSFTAYDSNDNVLGTGSATFTITEDNSKKSDDRVETYHDQASK